MKGFVWCEGLFNGGNQLRQLRSYFLIAGFVCGLLSSPVQSASKSDVQALSANFAALLIENACKKTGFAYARYADLNDTEKLVHLFTEDAEYVLAGRSFQGRKAIRSLFVTLQKKKEHLSRHLVSNYQVQAGEGDVVSGHSYITLYRLPKAGANDTTASTAPVAFAEYKDDYQVSGTLCLIKRRIISPVYVRQNGNKS